MRLLLDTHVFIWWDSSPEKLSPQARAACQNRKNVVLFSAASAWEMQIKMQLGKLRLRLALRDLIEQQQQANDIQVLPLTLRHVLALQELPVYHSDPFDRILIAQAHAEDATLITHDPAFTKYPVEILW